MATATATGDADDSVSKQQREWDDILSAVDNTKVSEPAPPAATTASAEVSPLTDEQRKKLKNYGAAIAASGFSFSSVLNEIRKHVGDFHAASALAEQAEREGRAWREKVIAKTVTALESGMLRQQAEQRLLDWPKFREFILPQVAVAQAAEYVAEAAKRIAAPVVEKPSAPALANVPAATVKAEQRPTGAMVPTNFDTAIDAVIASLAVEDENYIGEDDVERMEGLIRGRLREEKLEQINVTLKLNRSRALAVELVGPWAALRRFFPSRRASPTKGTAADFC